jgi:hypothetical protein
MSVCHLILVGTHWQVKRALRQPLRSRNRHHVSIVQLNALPVDVLKKDIQSSKQFFDSSQDFVAFCCLKALPKSSLIKSDPTLRSSSSIDTMYEFKLASAD